MTSSDIRLQHSDFVFEIIGAGGESFVVFADCLRVLSIREEFVCGCFLGVGGGKEVLDVIGVIVRSVVHEGAYMSSMHACLDVSVQ